MISKGLQRAVLAIALFILALDRLAKIYALGFLSSKSIDLGSYFRLKLSLNTNIALSLPLNGVPLYLSVSLAILVLFKYLYYFKQKNEPELSLLLTILIISAITNLLDRFFYGGVVDYIELIHFSSFNLADSMITFSIISLIILLTKSRKNEPSLE